MAGRFILPSKPHARSNRHPHAAPLPAALETVWRKEPFGAKWTLGLPLDKTMKTMSALQAKNAFGLMIDTARRASAH
jgi:hypothetical protein